MLPGTRVSGQESRVVGRAQAYFERPPAPYLSGDPANCSQHCLKNHPGTAPGLLPVGYPTPSEESLRGFP